MPRTAARRRIAIATAALLSSLALTACEASSVAPGDGLADVRAQCGNGRCTGRETCSTCPVDCGACVTDSGTPSGDAGSSSGGETSSATWANASIPAQSGAFAAELDVVPNSAPMDGLTALSRGPVGTFTDAAVIVRFNADGLMDVRDGATYRADAALRYEAGARYHVRIEVDVAAHRYNVHVTPPGGTTVALAVAYQFRDTQASIDRIDNRALWADNGTHTVSGFTLLPWTPSSPPPPPPPPPSGLLSFRPPGYTCSPTDSAAIKNPACYPGYVVVDVTPTSSRFVVTPGSGVNAFFRMPTVPVPNLHIEGYRNAVVIGGEIAPTGTNVNGVTLFRNDGIVHLEGIYVHGPSVRDAMALATGRTPSSGAHGATLQLQNSRIVSSYSDASYHGDAMQLWGTGSGWAAGWVGGVGLLRLDRVTLQSKLQCLFLGTHDGALEGADIRNTNMLGYGGNSGQVSFKTYRTDIHGWTSTMTLSNVWVASTGTGLMKTDWVVPNHIGTWYGNTGGTDLTRAVSLGADATGEYLYYSATADVSGIYRIGTPPDGDFAPASAVGIGYVPPGYR